MAAEKHTVVFMPSGKSGAFKTGTPVLQCARALGVDVDSICGGRGICGRCKVRFVTGDFAKFGIVSKQENLNPVTEPEQRYRLRSGLDQDMRLSCHSLIKGDVVIDVPPESQLHKQVVGKQSDGRMVDIDPVIRAYFVGLEAASLENPMGDLERLQAVLHDQWDLPPALVMDGEALKGLQKNLRKGNGEITVAVHQQQTIIKTWAGFHDRMYGMAFDIGSTTIAATLNDLETGNVLAEQGVMNPQIRYGEDVMSRISYTMMNEGGLDQLTAAVRQAIDDLINDVCLQAAVDAENIVALSLVGNPVMTHLFLGLDPFDLGTAPFALATTSAHRLKAGDLGLKAVSGGPRVYIPPAIAGHVGADAAAVILAEKPYASDDLSLIVDVGTNAEIVLGNSKHLWAASSPTGPAFEGGELECGQRASNGAIERVRIDRDTFQARYKIIGCDVWSDDPGFAAACETIPVTGICGSGIIEVIAEMFLSGLMDQDGVIVPPTERTQSVIEADGRTHRYVLVHGDQPIVITQNDVRAVQLAKAALYAGVRLLMDKSGISRVDRITLAGGFGNFIDPVYAMVLGLVPDCLPENITSAGNAAGMGARMLLLSRSARSELEQVVTTTEKIETAIEPWFQQHFVDAMAFPHKHDGFPELAKVVKLPDNKTPTTRPPGRRKSRRRQK